MRCCAPRISRPRPRGRWRGRWRRRHGAESGEAAEPFAAAGAVKALSVCRPDCGYPPLTRRPWPDTDVGRPVTLQRRDLPRCGAGLPPSPARTHGARSARAAAPRDLAGTPAQDRNPSTKTGQVHAPGACTPDTAQFLRQFANNRRPGQAPRPTQTTRMPPSPHATLPPLPPARRHHQSAHPQIRPAAKRAIGRPIRHEVGRNSGKKTNMTNSGTLYISDVDKYTSLRIIVA